MNKINNINEFYHHHLLRIFGLLFGILMAITIGAFLLSQYQQSNLKKTPINHHAPTIKSINAYNAFSGKKVTLIAEVDHAKRLPVHFNWQQLTGPTVNFTTDDNKISFQAPKISNDIKLTFSLVINTAQQKTQRTTEIMIKTSDKTVNKEFLFIAIILASLLALALELSARKNKTNGS
ncbi:hypothetical protein Q4489_09380 [Thalassotalea sp. 1_MG-2023]|uniref:hypothetical protein n=1 Tax=Thalassotalea sp. 1_MG-2023 TaxID=3062680 RepID=UPI0026E25E7D|nr:hypothetical protein [Thalassotalea sp. 1_MG-2023]MDO6427224.1 hypothetical protein [Thalassotalea sp. 1_MG-2023]